MGGLAETMAGRRALSKKIRFEVFKRDSFRCQYCGAEAPNVLLEIDHITPVAAGGSNELLNLITACTPCNSGKRDVPLSDQSVLVKQKQQLAELQKRREQLEMLLEWKEGLSDLNAETVERLAEYWAKHSHGWTVNEHGKLKLRKWLKQYTADELLTAMETALSQYIELDRNQPPKASSASVERALNSVPGICRVTRASKTDPDIRNLYYIRGIFRTRMRDMANYCNDAVVLDDLKAARSWNVPIDELREIALTARNWTQFRAMITDVIKEHGGE
jgi:hypothetical protein